MDRNIFIIPGCGYACAMLGLCIGYQLGGSWLLILGLLGCVVGTTIGTYITLRLYYRYWRKTYEFTGFWSFVTWFCH